MNALAHSIEALTEKQISSLDRAAALTAQLRFNYLNVPACRNMYSKISLLDGVDFATAIQSIPVITKEIFQSNSALDLLPHINGKPIGPFAAHRMTGGTTSTPGSVFYSQTDWDRAVAVHHQTFFSRLSGISEVRAFNNYNQGHISGPIFSAGISGPTSLCVNRGFRSDNDQALKEIIAHRCNVLIAPPSSTAKGGTLEDLLEADARAGSNRPLRAENCGTTPLPHTFRH